MLTRNKSLKLITVGLFVLAVAFYCGAGLHVDAFSSGPPASRTGAPTLGAFPAEPTCTLCHTSFALNSGTGALTITGLPATYMPNQEIAVTVTINQVERVRYGFQATVLDDQGRGAGTLVVTDGMRTQLREGAGNYAGRSYILHTTAGAMPSGTNQNSWTFTWRAPAEAVGRVTLYVASNAGSGGGGNQQDFIYNASASVRPADLTTGTVSAASFSPNAPLASETIAAIFGSDLAAGTATASEQPLPIELGGVRVRVRDSGGMERDAGLFFVSPSQINYVIPAGTANGLATINVVRDSNNISVGTVTIEAYAPGLFAANANGQGLAAAVLLRRNAAGQDSYEPIARFDAAQNLFVPVPIDFGAETDQLFLIVFGTGLRGRTAMQGAGAQVGGLNAELIFAGATPGFAGLDQANIRLPRTLAGRGDTNVVVVLGGKVSNTVTINFR
jgi:uncharacterized protein (TIGR03437 family)